MSGAYLQSLRENLARQVQRGEIQQWQADAELQRQQSQLDQTAIADPNRGAALDSYYQELARQVQSGAISQVQADAEMQRKFSESLSPVASNSLSFDTPSDVYNTGFSAAKAAQTQGNLLTNPNQFGPFGSSQVTIDPFTGQPVVTQSLSEGNQNVVSGVQGNAANASDVLNGLLSDGGAKYEDATYQQLTRDFGDRESRQRENLEQSLYNRGIGQGSGAAWENTIGDFEQRWDDNYANARSQAVNQAASQTAQLAPVFSGVAQGGYFAPSFQGFNAVDYNQVNTQDLFNALFSGQLSREDMQNQLDIANIQSETSKANAGLAANTSLAISNRPGAPAPAPEPSNPFNNAPLPGT